MSKRISINTKYFIASIFILVFVLNDLMFDFLFNFNTSDYISFGFTLGTSIITFIGSYKLLRLNVEDKAKKISAFVKSNFNHWQVIFSVLDILCGVISILSGLAVLGGIFKFVKITYIPVKCIVITNKSKTVAKSISKFSLIWTTGRILTKNNKGGIVKTWIKNNKYTLTCCIVLGAIGGFLGYTVPQTYWNLSKWAYVGISSGTVLVLWAMIWFLGGDTVKTALFRKFATQLDDERIKPYVEQGLNLIAEQKRYEIAEKELKAEAKVKNKEKKVEEVKSQPDATEQKVSKKEAKAEAKKLAEEEKAKAEAEERSKIEAIKDSLRVQNQNSEK